MKKFVFVSCIFCALFVGRIQAQVVFEDSQQRWKITAVESNENYTVIFCDITILTNKAGCFEAHEYDRDGCSIYISGPFGRLKMVEASYKGDYTPWHRYEGNINWNYYEKFCKDKVAHAMFYFPRIPAGIQTINWHFNGGEANPSAECDEFVCAQFDVKNLNVPNNPITTQQTDWTESKLRTYWSEHKPTPIEGIYSFIQASDKYYWGNLRHRLAIIKSDGQYQILYLDGANNKVWHAGEVKGILMPTTTAGAYKVEKWFLENKMPSTSDFYVDYRGGFITLLDAKYNVETQFMKLFPENDISDITDSSSSSQSSSSSKTQNETPLGNGSGFFVGGSVIATNCHVVQDGKRFSVVLNTPNGTKEYRAKVLCVDKVNDLALLSIDDNDFVPFKSLPYSVYSRTIDVGSSIFTMGYPKVDIMGMEMKITDGIINSKTGFQGDIVNYQISAPIQPGNSGGPMFDRAGNLVGITASKVVKQGIDGVYYAIKSNYLNNLIDAAPISIPDIGTNSLAGKDLPAQIKALTPYVVMVLVY